MLTKLNLLILLLATLVTAPAMAKVYKWKNANGVTQYTSTPPPTSLKIKDDGVKEVKIRKTPKSSLTHKPATFQPSATQNSNKTSKAKNKKSSKKKVKQNTRAQDLAECRNMSDRDKEKMNKEWEKYGKAAVAAGRETEKGLKKGMKFIRDMSNCKF